MTQLRKYLHLYIGCKTNKGLFSGIRKDILFIQSEQQLLEEYKIREVGSTLFLYLRQLTDLTTEESKQLIEEGIVIGRPHGYTFSNTAFLYLLSLSVDIFGFIIAGYAKDIKTLA